MVMVLIPIDHPSSSDHHGYIAARENERIVGANRISCFTFRRVRGGQIGWVE
jgi:hypothetical protein